MRRPHHAVTRLIGVVTLVATPNALQAQVLDLVPPTIEVGEAEGEEWEEFGRIVDVRRDPEGRIFVLDEYRRRISTFDPQGQFVRHIGRPGQGPAEFQFPAAMAMDGSGGLHVLDRTNARVSTFRVEGGTLSFSSDFRLRWPASDLCFLGDRLFLLTEQEEAIIREVDKAGRTIHSFGPPEAPLESMEAAMGPGPHPRLSYGLLACDAASESVIFVSTILPVVRSFSPSGELRWSTSLGSFATVSLFRSRAGQCCVNGPNPETGTISSNLSVALTGDGYLVVTESEFAPPDLTLTYEVHVLTLATGEVVQREPWPWRVDGVWRGSLYGFGTEPFLRVIAN